MPQCMKGVEVWGVNPSPTKPRRGRGRVSWNGFCFYLFSCDQVKYCKEHFQADFHFPAMNQALGCPWMRFFYNKYELIIFFHWKQTKEGIALWSSEREKSNLEKWKWEIFTNSVHFLSCLTPICNLRQLFFYNGDTIFAILEKSNRKVKMRNPFKSGLLSQLSDPIFPISYL